MEISREEELFASVENKRKAYRAMCRVSVLLFAFAFFSSVISVLVSYFSVSFYSEMQSFFVKFICFFGVSRSLAVAAAKMLLTSVALEAFFNMATVLITIVLPAFLFSKVVYMEKGESFRLRGKCVKGIFPLFGVTQLLTATALIFSTKLFEFLLPSVEQQSADFSTLGAEFNVFGFVMQILCICVVVPVAEEYAFRGVVFNYLKKYGLSFAVISSAMIFGISHSSPTQSVYAFCFGIIACLTVAVTGNLKTAIVLHALNNLMIVAQENLGLYFGETVQNVVYCIALLLIFALAFVGLYRFSSDTGLVKLYLEAQRDNDKDLLLKAGIKDVFVWPVVIYVLIYAISFAMIALG